MRDTNERKSESLHHYHYFMAFWRQQNVGKLSILKDNFIIAYVLGRGVFYVETSPHDLYGKRGNGRTGKRNLHTHHHHTTTH